MMAQGRVGFIDMPFAIILLPFCSCFDPVLRCHGVLSDCCLSGALLCIPLLAHEAQHDHHCAFVQLRAAFLFGCDLFTAKEYCEKMREDTEDSSSLRASHYDIGLFRNIQSAKLFIRFHSKSFDGLWCFEHEVSGCFSCFYLFLLYMCSVSGVMGDNWMLWLLPINGPAGDGLQWGIAEQKKSEAAGSVGPADLPPEAQVGKGDGFWNILETRQVNA